MKISQNHRYLIALATAALLGSVTLSACVSKAKYEDDMMQKTQTVEELEESLAACNSDVSSCRASLEEVSSEAERLSEELANTQEQVLALSEESSEQSEALENARAEQRELLNEVNRLRQEAQRRQEIYEELVGRFQSMIDAGQLDVSIEDGRIVINLPQDILFRSGNAQVSDDGEQTLRDVGNVLADFQKRSFQVEGHTDNVPISTARFPSNWELSTARALAVVHILEDTGVSPDNLSAAGYGQHQPVAPNDTDENRALNRRIEIVMLPNIEQLAPDAITESTADE
jgi:chemotaxis protein MotB